MKPCLPPLEFAKLIRSHWSIFQQTRVTGLIEFTDIPHYSKGGEVFLSKLVRLKTSHAGSELPGQVARNVTNADKKSLVIRTQGDGRVLIYREGRLVYELDVKTGEENPDPESGLKSMIENALNTCNVSRHPHYYEYLKPVLQQVIEEISDAQGEGCFVVFAPDSSGSDVESFLERMDRQGRHMVWRRPRQLLGIDASLLRALLILDGATLVSASTVEPRFLVHSYDDCNPAHGFSAIRLMDNKGTCRYYDTIKSGLSKTRRLKKLREKLLSLDGKGTRHHGAANLTILLWQKKISNFQVVTISADGPVTNWISKLSLP